MTDAAPKAKTTASPPAEPTDAELERLKLDKAKQTLRQDIAANQAAALASLAPGVGDTPKGEVSLGTKAGSLGPWLAHDVLAEAGTKIAECVNQLNLQVGSTVLVTDDAALLASDVTSRQVQGSMTARANELEQARDQVQEALEKLNDDIDTYTERETPPATRRVSDDEEQREDFVTVEIGDVLAFLIGKADTAEGRAKESTEPKTEEAKEEKEEGAAAPEESAEGPASAIGVAVDLVRLLATDYTLTSVTVPATSATLATVTAGELSNLFAPKTNEEGGDAQQTDRRSDDVAASGGAEDETHGAEDGTGNGEHDKQLAPHGENQRNSTTETGLNHVVLDGFTVTPSDSATLKEFDDLTRAAASTALDVQELRSLAAGVSAQAADYQAAADKLQAAWTAASTDKDARPGAANKLKAALDELTARITRRSHAAGAAASVAESADAAVAAARADLTALTTPDAAGATPLLRTCSREGLRTEGDNNISHVLVVEAANIGADVVTRRSILGSSGRVSYLAGTNTTWALVEASTGRLRGGGAVRPARQVTHDLASGDSITSPIKHGKKLGDDPLAKTETWARFSVLLLALTIAVLGVALALKAVVPLF